MPVNIAVLASGNGSNAQSIMDKIAAGALDARLRLVVSNRPGAGVLERARKADIPCALLDHTLWPDREAYDAALADVLKRHGAEYIAMAGYMRLVTAGFLHAFKGRVVNIHPALLPSFPGLHGGAGALAYGVTLSGCTVHFVEEAVDGGPIVIQAAVPVRDGEDLDCLMARIHALEHRVYPQALQWLAQGRITKKGRRVCLAPSGAKRAPCGEECLIWPPLEEGF
ncbi:MAG: phosphoribosylglycinamide formyltransferase [Desulfovibrio sp.]|jgi:phosphoribosylglycinamide formyltransferase-1|nr:phosphoribosylglycinamide formyltransferase [Desulfovibrio sp.]